MVQKDPEKSFAFTPLTVPLCSETFFPQEDTSESRSSFSCPLCRMQRSVCVCMCEIIESAQQVQLT